MKKIPSCTAPFFYLKFKFPTSNIKLATSNNKVKRIVHDGRNLRATIPFMASIMTLDRCIRNGTGSGSVNDERGVISF
ncbi:hypothetical protein [Megasphaera elsdenii]|uniref:hypothetical protein n=1 Tax=Megasphaera elsdenii TaxID=907 RepID=UPI0033948B7F